MKGAKGAKNTGLGMQKSPMKSPSPMKIMKSKWALNALKTKAQILALQKKPAVAEPETTTDPKNSKDMVQILNAKLMLLNEPWKDLPFEQQQKILGDLPTPSRDMYNAFHKAMAVGKDTPTWWRETYEDIQAQKMERGVVQSI